MNLRLPSLAGVLAALALATAPPATAQCLVPDGLSGPCCLPAAPSLPTSFPPLPMPGLGVCWDACTPTTQACVDVMLAGFNPTPLCTQYQVDLSVTDCLGVPIMSGVVTLDYTRTWEELEPVTAVSMQVWRFAAKVDLISSGISATTCPEPSCTAAAGQAFFYGYVDYVRNCATGAVEGALVLFHGCDRFIHDPAFSSIPGSYHPTRSYAIVAPHTVANPFSPAILAPPGGVLTGEGLRNPPTAVGDPCINEEPILQGDMQPLVQACLCPLSFQPPQQAGVRTSISGACGGSAYSLNVFPVAPWYHLVETSMGSWTSGANYPGPEQAWVAEGLFLYSETCSLPAPAGHFDIFYGAVTDGGYPVTSSTTPSQTFVDLASNYSIPLTAPIAFPLFGTVAPTDHLIYGNL